MGDTADSDQEPLGQQTSATPSSDTSSPKVCTHCGRPVDTLVSGSDVHGSDLASSAQTSSPFLLDPFDDDDTDQRDVGRREDSAATRTPRFGRRAALGAVAAIAVLGVGLGSFINSASSGQDPVEDAVLDRDDGVFGADSDNGAADASGATGSDSQEPAGDPNFPPSDEHMEEDEIATLFAESVGGDTTYGVAYVSDEGLETVGPWGSAQPEVRTAQTLDQAIGNPLISNGSMTWAIDDADPQFAYIVSNRFEVVTTQLSGNLAFVRKEKNRVEIGLTAYGGRQPGVQIPPLSDVVTVAGRGLLVAPATGGTYVVEPNGGMSRMSEDRVVSAGLDSEVYQRCDEVLVCEIYAMFTDSAGQRVSRTLELDADTALTMSPDGSHVAGLSGDDRSLTVVGTDSGESVELGEQTVLATGWAPDSSFLVVAVPGQLLIVYPEEAEVLSISLPSDPVSDSLLVFTV